MKPKLFSLLALVIGLCASVLFTGCDENSPSKIQLILDKTLPPDFTGNLDVGHKNVYFDFDIRATGLKRTTTGWTWASLSYRRNGRFSNGWVTLAPGRPPLVTDPKPPGE